VSRSSGAAARPSLALASSPIGPAKSSTANVIRIGMGMRRMARVIVRWRQKLQGSAAPSDQ
jgi:hypothetical protein